MAGMIPSAAVLDSWATIGDARSWAGVSEAMWSEVAATLGDKDLNVLILLAGIPDDVYIAAVAASGATEIQRVALKLLLNAVKGKFGMPCTVFDAPTTATAPSSATATTTTSLPTPVPPKIKLSHVIDQAKEQEVPLLGEAELRGLRRAYDMIYRDVPLEGVEVTDVQLSALKYLVDNGLTPYADFGVWGPYGARAERRMRFTSHYLDSEGMWHTSEVPGPDCLENWRKCWETFSTAAVMLNLATPATLVRYISRFNERCERYSRCWHLCVQADVRCRSEWMAAERRRQERFHQEHPSISGFRPEMPWDSVFKEAADNQEFWQRELMEPAIWYEQRRGQTAPSHTFQQPEADPTTVNRPTGKRKRGTRGTGGGGGGGGGNNNSNSGNDQPNPRATQICFDFSRHANGCKEPCPAGRFHGCEGCWKRGVRGIHCCYKGKGGGGGGGSGGGGKGAGRKGGKKSSK